MALPVLLLVLRTLQPGSDSSRNLLVPPGLRSPKTRLSAGAAAIHGNVRVTENESPALFVNVTLAWSKPCALKTLVMSRWYVPEALTATVLVPLCTHSKVSREQSYTR